ncbi:MAG: PEP/pyruvate-binding domain-containing protein [Candidatus Eiseniibacteriota bacterium]
MNVAGIHGSSADGAPPAREQVGGKGHALLRMVAWAREGGFDVPPFVVLEPETAAAIGRVRDDSGDDAGDNSGDDSGEDPGHALQVAALLAALAKEGIAGSAAVRSSAVEEDGTLRSYAGQFATMLNVPLDEDAGNVLVAAIARVVLSAGSAHAAAYRARAALEGRPRMAVLVQAQLDPVVAGVAFSADPLGGHEDIAVVSAVYGLGEGLVSGALDADTWRVPRDPADPLEAQIATKTHAIRPAPMSGTWMPEIPAGESALPALAPGEVRRIADCARFLATKFGSPQDVEWALAGPGRRLCVLQSRPITSQRAGVRRLWDNSNIIESYAGVTTPLTFAFARSAYETVYRQFCDVMGVPRTTIEANRLVFAHLLGLLHGRVYYNLRNWYRMLALLPGFAFNRGFMEKMMGVREPLDEAVEPPGAADRARDLLRLARMVVRMVVEERRLDGRVPEFHARVERALAPLDGLDVAVLPPEDAIALYRKLEQELLHQWKTPIVNDFFAMVFFGTLTRLTERWLPGEPPTLVNDLLCGEGGIVSTVPARLLMELARRVTADAALASLFDEIPDDTDLWKRLSSDAGTAGFFRELESYRKRFGDRCMEELKLETVTLSEEPATILSTVRAYRAAGLTDPEAAIERERAIRRAAEARVDARLRGPRGGLYRWVLKRARRRVRDRENLRFERTRVFGVVRRIFLALGRHLEKRNTIQKQRDVFDLTPEEVFAHFEGVSLFANLRDVAQLRRRVFDRWAAEPAPPDRFETVGSPAEWLDLPGARAAKSAPGGIGACELRGTGACPGIVRARVRVVTDPRGVRDLAGCILVAERTDPGWTLLFPVAAGLLVERGSLLSHSAIVAREVGLPCIVGVRGLLSTLTDGDEVEMDGTTGEVRILARAKAAR